MTVQINGDNTIAAPGFSGPDADTGLQTATNELRLVTGGSARLFIDSSGRVGVGTSSPTTSAGGVDISSGGIGLVVGADGSVSTRTNSTDKIFRIGSAHYTNAEEPVCIAFGQNLSSNNELNFGGGSAALNAATYIRFFTAANNTTTSGTERMRIDSSGNVGIGITNPGALLEVQGADTAIGSNGTILVKANSAGADDGGQITLGSANGRHVAVAGRSEGSSGTAGYLQLGVRGSSGDIVERLRIDSSGRVGIGTSSPGSYNADAADLVIGSSGSNGLTIVSGTANNGNIFFADGTSGNDQLRGFIQYNHQQNFLHIGTNATSAIRIDSSQRVGIGTATPTTITTGNTNLTIGPGSSGSQGSEIHMESATHNGSSNGANISYIGSDLYLVNREAGFLGLFTQANERARIDSSGRLLVGRSSSQNENIGGTGYANLVQIEGNATGAGLSVANSAAAARINITRDLASDSITNGMDLGFISFGAESPTSVERARIQCNAEFTNTNERGGRLQFYTCANSDHNPTERLRITNTGAFGLSGANYGTSGQVLTSQGSGSAPQWATPAGTTWTWDTSQTTLSGNTSVTVSGIPSTATRVLVQFYNVSNNTNQDWIFRLGNSSGIVTSGYHVSAGYMFTGNTSRTNGFHTYATGTASHKWTGFIDCVNLYSTLWYCQMFFNAESDANVHFAVGKVGVTTLDRINFSTYSGTFDDGGILVSYMEP